MNGIVGRLKDAGIREDDISTSSHALHVRDCVTSACSLPTDMETPASKAYAKNGLMAFGLPEVATNPRECSATKRDFPLFTTSTN